LVRRSGMSLFECPACGLKQEALAKEVAHKCPKRERQPSPVKGKRRLPEVVHFVKIDPIEPQVKGHELNNKNAVAHAPLEKKGRRTKYASMTLKLVGAK
jgi:hypothetical protein